MGCSKESIYLGISFFARGVLKIDFLKNFLIKNWTNFVKIRTDFSNLKEEEKNFQLRKKILTISINHQNITYFNIMSKVQTWLLNLSYNLLCTIM